MELTTLTRSALTIVDILAVTLLLYNFVHVLRGRRAVHVLSGLTVLILIYSAASWLELRLLRQVLAWLAPYGVIAFIVMFQSELRGYLSRLGRVRWVQRGWMTIGGRMERRDVIEEIALAVEHLAESHTGALIVIERDIGLRTFIESGVTIDAVVSRDLLLAIFQPHGHLHDGAVILHGGRIAAAACFLPLHVTPPMSSVNDVRKIGTRHRAAIGVTEETDALAIVVSEETGRVSIGWRAELESNITIDHLRERLTLHSTGQRPVASPSSEVLNKA
jgi:diadenylate cyclase